MKGPPPHCRRSIISWAAMIGRFRFTLAMISLCAQLGIVVADCNSPTCPSAAGSAGDLQNADASCTDRFKQFRDEENMIEDAACTRVVSEHPRGCLGCSRCNCLADFHAAALGCHGFDCHRLFHADVAARSGKGHGEFQNGLDHWPQGDCAGQCYLNCSPNHSELPNCASVCR